MESVNKVKVATKRNVKSSIGNKIGAGIKFISFNLLLVPLYNV